MTSTNEQFVFDAAPAKECCICFSASNVTAENPLMRCRASCNAVFHANCVENHLTLEQKLEVISLKQDAHVESCPGCKSHYPVFHSALDPGVIRTMFPREKLEIYSDVNEEMAAWAIAADSNLTTDEELTPLPMQDLAERVRARYRSDVMEAIAPFVVPSALEHVRSVNVLPDLEKSLTDKLKDMFEFRRVKRVRDMVNNNRDLFESSIEKHMTNMISQLVSVYKKQGFDKSKFLDTPVSEHKTSLKKSLPCFEAIPVVANELKSLRYHATYESLLISDTVKDELLSYKVVRKFTSAVLEGLQPPRQNSDASMEPVSTNWENFKQMSTIMDELHGRCTASRRREREDSPEEERRTREKMDS